MVNLKTIDNEEKYLKIYGQLSADLRKIDLSPSYFQPKIKLLAIENSKNLTDKESIVSFLSKYDYSFLFKKNEDEFQKNIFFLGYFLELAIANYGENFLLVDLLNKLSLHQEPGIWEKLKNKFLKLIGQQKETQKISQSDLLNHGPLSINISQIISNVDNKEKIITDNLLIRNIDLTIEAICEMAKFLNPISMIDRISHNDQITERGRVNENSLKDNSKTTPKLIPVTVPGSQSIFDNLSNNNPRSKNDDYLIESDVGYSSGSDSFKAGDEFSDHLNISSRIEEDNSDLISIAPSDSESSELPLSFMPSEELIRRSKEKVIQWKTYLPTEQHPNTSERNASNRNSELEIKLEKCRGREKVYQNLHQYFNEEFNSYKNNNPCSSEKLDYYKFKFDLNEKMCDLYTSFLSQESIKKNEQKDDQLLKYYQFKYSINKTKLNDYMKQLEEKIEKNMFEKDIFEKYAYKCEEIYLPRLKYYLEKIINIHNLTPSGLLLSFDKELDWQAQQKTKLEQLLARQLPSQSETQLVAQNQIRIEALSAAQQKAQLAVQDQMKVEAVLAEQKEKLLLLAQKQAQLIASQATQLDALLVEQQQAGVLTGSSISPISFMQPVVGQQPPVVIPQPPVPPVVGQQSSIPPPPSGKSNSDKNPNNTITTSMLQSDILRKAQEEREEKEREEKMLQARRLAITGDDNDNDDNDDDNSKDWYDEEDHSYSRSLSC